MNTGAAETRSTQGSRRRHCTGRRGGLDAEQLSGQLCSICPNIVVRSDALSSQEFAPPVALNTRRRVVSCVYSDNSDRLNHRHSRSLPVLSNGYLSVVKGSLQALVGRNLLWGLNILSLVTA